MEPIDIVVKCVLKFIGTFESIIDDHSEAIEYLKQLLIYVSVIPSEIQADGTMYMEYFKGGYEQISIQDDGDSISGSSGGIDSVESVESVEIGNRETSVTFEETKATVEMKLVYMSRIAEICHDMVMCDFETKYIYECIKAVLIHILLTSSVLAMKYLRESSIITIDHKREIHGKLIEKINNSKVVYNSLNLEGYLKPNLQEYKP